MTSLLAQQLDELMGKDRDAPSDQKKETRFDDDDVCKPFLVAFCPHEMFVNTKADLGPCTKLHDMRYREQYSASSRFMKLGYEEDFLNWLSRMQNDMDRKIKKHKERLELTQAEAKDDAVPMDPHKARMDAKVKELEEKINEYVAKAEALGAEGRVAESQESTRVAERYRMEREQHRMAMHNLPFSPLDEVKPMEVCEICGCFLIVGDAQQRIDEHMLGKQHIGYARIRETIKILQKRMDEKRKVQAEEYEARRKLKEKDTDDRKAPADKEKEKEVDRRDRPRDVRDRNDRDRSDRDRNSRYSSSSSSRHSRGRDDRGRDDRHRQSRDHRSRSRDKDRRRRDDRRDRDDRSSRTKREGSRDRSRRDDERKSEKRARTSSERDDVEKKDVKVKVEEEEKIIKEEGSEHQSASPAQKIETGPEVKSEINGESEKNGD